MNHALIVSEPQGPAATPPRPPEPATVEPASVTAATVTAMPSPPATAAAAAAGITLAAPSGENSFASFYKTGLRVRRHRRMTPARQIARLACILPLVAIGIAALTFPLHSLLPRVAVIVDAINGGLLFIGLVCATVALSAGRRAGRRGVLFPAAAGTFFSGAFVGLIAGWLTLAPRPGQPVAASSAPGAAPTDLLEAPTAAPPKPARAPHAKPAPKLDVNDPARTGRDAMAKYAGWYGAATAKGATICIGEFAAAAPVVNELRSLFDGQPNVLLIGIDNTHGHAPLTIDPSSLRAESADGRRVLALPVQTVLETAQSDRDHLMALFNHLLEATPGQTATYGFAFLPAETDLRSINRVSLVLNGHRVVLAGQYLTAAQKADLARRAEAQASR